MVKIDRVCTSKAQEAIRVLGHEKSKKSGTYNVPAVNYALAEIFHGKCYICENKEVSSWQIEHLQPPNGNRDLEFEWDNLFWSCAHCNNIKGNNYYPILDCTKVHVDDYISFRSKGWLDLNFELIVEETGERTLVSHNTCALLRKVYYGETAQKEIESRFIREKMRDELIRFTNYLREYIVASGEPKKDLCCVIRKELEASSAFAAFKRWIVRDNPHKYLDFLECWKEC